MGVCGCETRCAGAVVGLGDVGLSWLGSVGGGTAHAADVGGGVVVVVYGAGDVLVGFFW